MLVSELKELFTLEEFELLVEYMIEKNYLWEKDSCHVWYVQEFLTILEDNERKNEIISICIQNYPQILGFAPAI